jgi:hypothetical protein
MRFNLVAYYTYSKLLLLKLHPTICIIRLQTRYAFGWETTKIILQNLEYIPNVEGKKKQKQRPQLCKLKRAKYDQKTKQTLLLSGLPMIHYIFIQL